MERLCGQWQLTITSEGWCKKERVEISALAFATLSCILHSSQLFIKEFNLFCYSCMCSGMVYITFSSHSTYRLELNRSFYRSDSQRIYDVVKCGYTQLICEPRGALRLWIGDRSLAVVCVCGLNSSTVYLAFLRGLLIVFWQRTPLFSRETSMLMWETTGTAFMIFFPSLDFCASHSSSITNTMYTISMSISAHGLKAWTLGSRVKTGGELSTN